MIIIMHYFMAIFLIVACLCAPIRAEKVADESVGLEVSFSEKPNGMSGVWTVGNGP